MSLSIPCFYVLLCSSLLSPWLVFVGISLLKATSKIYSQNTVFRSDESSSREKGPMSNQVLSKIIDGIYNHMNCGIHPVVLQLGCLIWDFVEPKNFSLKQKYMASIIW